MITPGSKKFYISNTIIFLSKSNRNMMYKKIYAVKHKEIMLDVDFNTKKIFFTT